MSELTPRGPEVAIGHGVTVALVQPARSHRPHRTSAIGRARPWHPVELLPLAYYVAAASVLAIGGYPAWRIACLALPATVQQLGMWRLRAYDPRACAKAAAEQCAWGAVLIQLSCLATSIVAVAVTGGVASPLLVIAITSYLAAVLFAGDRRETRILLAVTALDVGVLALLPAAWTGPALARPLHALLVVMSVLGVGAVLAPFHRATREVRDALARAREEMASEALQRARNLEQVGAKVAHELKNPLSAIKALVQLGAREAPEALSQERLQIVEKEISRMQEILADYLSFTRPLQEVRPERIELGALVSEALGVLAARADDRRVTLSARGDGMIEADPRRLREAILNLVANAIEATQPGGDVAVEVLRTDDAAEVVIRDTGCGMPPEVLGRLGTPFFTTRDEGTGLGVVLARSVVAQHGGALRYESEPGRGTTAIITLPTLQASSSRCRDGARAAR
jgi:two-component system, NtrC family, sensor histidine kinase HydH